MANQVRARLGGDDYQHLFSWHHILGLLRPKTTIRSIRLEDEDALSVDDLTVRHSDGRCFYYQVKWHVDQRSAYSEKALTESMKAGRSLLSKWYRSYRRIVNSGVSMQPVITLVSNWGWALEDVLPRYISGLDDRIEESFFSSQPASAAGKLREKLGEHLQVDNQELSAFLRTLRFQVLSGGIGQFTNHVAERMEHIGLRFDESALLCAVGAVRTWIRNGPIELTSELAQSRIVDLQLSLPAAEPRAINVYMSTIKTQRFDVEPDYCLDWREYFTGPESCKGHETLLPELWNTRMMPDLVNLERSINATETRRLRVRGKARLSASAHCRSSMTSTTE